MEHGRHVQAALDEMQGGTLRWSGNTGRSTSTPDPDAVRRMFETIGTLFGAADLADAVSAVFPNYPDSGGGAMAQTLAGFLDEVKRAIIHPGHGREMLAAIARYEAVRDPQARTTVVSPGDGGEEVDAP